MTNSASNDMEIIQTLEAVIAKRKKTMPSNSYTAQLFTAGERRIRQKVGEEAVEFILAESKQDIIAEGADLLYHSMVFLQEKGMQLHDILQELHKRQVKDSE